ncbi:bifunctional oligoribonuclease/PAP phosphatase NrnA [Patescibacteria group bacterium]
MQLLFNQLQTKIKEAESVLFVCHRNPDPDTIGSAIALGRYIESLGKSAEYFCIDKVPDGFLFIRGIEKFISDIDIFKKNYDLVIFLDCADVGRCGLDNILDYKNQFWTLIDHHVNEEKNADLVIKDNKAAATCEIIYKFLEYAGFSIEPSIATALLSGLLIDTNFLSNQATKGDSAKIASELSSLGADYRSILKTFYFNKHPEILKIWGRALSRLKYDKDKNIAMTAILQDDIRENKILDEAMEGFANFLNAVLKSDIVMVLREYDNQIRGNIRSSHDEADVAKIAEKYGGGGHKKAAGFMCEGRLVEGEDEWHIDPVRSSQRKIY